ncbi:MAG TPA: ABC transporter substrate-binding protein [Xanthobacteraceae bacterium]|jgi:branched-chain amino acid transport system substrate-binding protein|nr:ABC transporter substrate-binding protein [Xanthobacteraceae bacterium]
MPKLILSYRRSDSAGIAGRIFDRLSSRYGHDSVFMDVDNIPFGIDFRQYIREALAECDALIVVVGPRWVGERPDGSSRIRDETDPVRVEVETALERGIPIVPVLVDGAVMPKASDLPDSLGDFSFRNAAEVDTGRDFHPHLDRLIRSLDRLLQHAAPRPQSSGVAAAGPGWTQPSHGPDALSARDSRSTFSRRSTSIALRRRVVVAIVAGTAVVIGVLGVTILGRPTMQPVSPTLPPAASEPEPKPVADTSPRPQPAAHLSTARPITVGVAGPMSGDYAAFGSQFRTGAELAVEDINTSTGVLGKTLKLEFGDDLCDPKQAKTVAEKFVALKLPMVAGHFCSSSSIAASDTYADGEIVQITPGSTNPTFTERGLWSTFRTCSRDDQQGLFAGIYLARNYSSKKIAIIHDETVYGNGLADQAKRALNNAGVKETLFESFSRGQKDYGPLIAKLKGARIDVVLIGGFAREAGLIVRQMREQGMRAPMIGSESIADTEFWSAAGPAGEGTLFTFGQVPLQKPSAAPIVKKLRDKGKDPGGYTLYAYAAIQVWASAVDDVNSTDARKVAATLKFGSWSTVLGQMSFDQKGDPTLLDYVMYIWKKDGTFAALTGS